EEEAEGGVPFTVLEAAPLDVRARACNNRLGVRGGRQTGVRRADRGPTGATPEDTSSTPTMMARITATPRNLICEPPGRAALPLSAANATDAQPLCKSGQSSKS